MRLPQRTRGLVIGLVTLAIGPAIAASLTPAMTARTSSTLAVASPIVNATSLPDATTMKRHPLPVVVVTPVPTPTPKPRPVVLTTPRPIPAAPPANYPPGSVQQDIINAANAWGVDPNWMLRIAKCESNFHPTSVNPAGPYEGLFQFLPRTFYANGGTNIWDPVDQSNIAAKMLAHGQAHQWSCA